MTTQDSFMTIRRLPVYVLVDCSGSMAGEPIAAMEMGIRSLLGELMHDPQALETVWLSVITFSSVAEQIVPLMDIHEFRVPKLEASGTTSLGEAIELLAERIDEEVRKTTKDQKGDYQPLAYVFTDGQPTDQWEDAVREFHAAGRATVIACGAGPEVDPAKLRRLSDTVVLLNDTQPGTLSRFMEWVSKSVTMTSRSLGTRCTSGAELPEVPPDQGIQMLP
jgi:uncharacterized protein YegL